MNSTQLGLTQLEKLRHLDSCSVANAIEIFEVRLRNVGFADSRVRCVFQDLPPMVGFAATARIRTSEPPMQGDNYYYRLDWLDHVLSIPPPRVLVMEDLDQHPGLGSFIGDVHASILRSFGCIGMVTNGAVRNLPEIQALNFQLFAGNVSVSHAFAHVLDFGGPVIIGNMQVRPGDLLHGDRHGVQTIPLEIADRVPGVAQAMIEQERELIELSRSPDFSPEQLRAAVSALRAKRSASKFRT